MVMQAYCFNVFSYNKQALWNYIFLPQSTFEVNLFPHTLLVTINNKGTFIAYKSLKTMIKAQNHQMQKYS